MVEIHKPPVDSSRPVSANTGHSPTPRRTGQIDPLLPFLVGRRYGRNALRSGHCWRIGTFPGPGAGIALWRMDRDSGRRGAFEIIDDGELGCPKMNTDSGLPSVESLRNQGAAALAAHRYADAIAAFSAALARQPEDARTRLQLGLALQGAGRHAEADLKVLFLTGYAENAAVGNGRMEHSMEVITKPFDLDKLVAKVEGMISR
jgi:hypothetical protein